MHSRIERYTRRSSFTGDTKIITEIKIGKRAKELMDKFELTVEDISGGKPIKRITKPMVARYIERNVKTDY